VAARWQKKFEDIFIRFDTTHESDRHTHTHLQTLTDRHRMTAYHALA